MSRYNYFDDDDDIQVSKFSIKDTAVSVLNKLKSLTQKKETAENEEQKTPAEPEYDITAPKPSIKDNSAYVPAPKPEISLFKETISLDEDEPSPTVVPVHSADIGDVQEDKEEILDAIKAFSHKSGEKIASVARTVNKTVKEKNPLEELEKLEHASRGKKAVVTIFMLLMVIVIFVSMVGFVMHSINKENSRISEFNKNAGSVCADYVAKYGTPNYENLYNTYGVAGYRLTGLCFARELDFNNDGTSELMVCYNKNGEFYNEVWGEDDGEFVLLFSEKTAQSSNKAEDAWAVLYYKNNKYQIGLHDEKDITKASFYQLKGNKFVKKMDCTYDKTTESYMYKDESDSVLFERIKLSVLREEKAAVSADEAFSIIEGFTGTQATSTTDSGKKEPVERDIKSAYYEIVEDYNKRYGNAKLVESGGISYVDGLASVELIDFDGNGKNELFLVYRKTIKVRGEDAHGEFIVKEEPKYYIEIYRYSGEKAIMCYSNEGISNGLSNSNDMYYILRYMNKQVNYCVNTFKTENYGRKTSATTSCLTFDGKEFKAQQKASYERSYGYTQYYLDGKSTYQSNFDKECGDIPIFGTDNYDKNTYQLVYVQRSSTSELNSLIEKTEKNIQELNPSYIAD